MSLPPLELVEEATPVSRQPPLVVAQGGATVMVLIVGIVGLFVSARPSAQREVVAAREATAEARSFRVEMTMELRGFRSGTPDVTVRASGVLDYESRRGQLSIAYLASSTQMIIDGENAYLEEFPGSGRWRRVPGRQFEAAPATDPARLLDALAGATGATAVGSESVRGEPTKRYRFTVRLDAVEGSPPSTSTAAGAAPVPAELWIDDQGRARRMTMTVAPSAVSPGATVEIAMEFYDFGVAVDVQPPPPDQVVG